MKKTVLLTVLASALLSQAASAQAIYTSGHGDVGAAYDPAAKEFEPHWHLHAGAIVDGSPLASDAEYDPDDLVAQGSATRVSPSGGGGLSGLIGVPDGSTIYAMGSSAYQPNLGFGVEELDPSDWIGNITLNLTGWTAPSGAHFALYTTNLAGTAVVDRIFSTFNPAATDFGNSFTMTPGDHLHFQWGFTSVGNYTLTFTWNGTHAVDGLISTSADFTIQIIPEPATAGLLALGAFLLLMRRRGGTCV